MVIAATSFLTLGGALLAGALLKGRPRLYRGKHGPGTFRRELRAAKDGRNDAPAAQGTNQAATNSTHTAASAHATR